jgi:hypothetical protein
MRNRKAVRRTTLSEGGQKIDTWRDTASPVEGPPNRTAPTCQKRQSLHTQTQTSSYFPARAKSAQSGGFLPRK